MILVPPQSPHAPLAPTPRWEMLGLVFPPGAVLVRKWHPGGARLKVRNPKPLVLIGFMLKIAAGGGRLRPVWLQAALFLPRRRWARHRALLPAPTPPTNYGLHRLGA
jgi:hypothetical protein